MPCAAKSAPYTSNNIFTMKHAHSSNQEDPFVSSQPIANHLTYELPAISTGQIMQREVAQSPSRRQRLETSTETIIHTYVPKGHPKFAKRAGDIMIHSRPNDTEQVRENTNHGSLDSTKRVRDNTIHGRLNVTERAGDIMTHGHPNNTEQVRDNTFHGHGHPVPERARDQNPTTPLRLQHTYTQYEAHRTESSYNTNPDLAVVRTASLNQGQQSRFLEKVTMSLEKNDSFQYGVKQGQQSTILEKVAMSLKGNGPFQNGATVTSYQLVSTKQASILQQLVLNRCIQDSIQMQECHGTIYPKELLLGSPTRLIARIQWNYPTMNDHTLQVIIPKRRQSLGFATRIQHRLGPNLSIASILCSAVPKHLLATVPYQIVQNRSIARISAHITPNRPLTTINYQIVRNQPIAGISHPTMAKKDFTTIPYRIVRTIAPISRPVMPNRSFTTIPYQIVLNQSLATFSIQTIPKQINYQNTPNQPFARMPGQILPENPATLVLYQTVPGQPTTIQPSCTTYTTTTTGSDHLLPNREGNDDTEDPSSVMLNRFLFCVFAIYCLAFFDRLGMGLF